MSDKLWPNWVPSCPPSSTAPSKENCELTAKSPVGVLHLNLHRQYFAEIAARTKRIEYRRRTAYWRRRLESRHYGVIVALTLKYPG
jgi:hypothetical protein